MGKRSAAKRWKGELISDNITCVRSYSWQVKNPTLIGASIVGPSLKWVRSPSVQSFFYIWETACSGYYFDCPSSTSRRACNGFRWWVADIKLHYIRLIRSKETEIWKKFEYQKSQKRRLYQSVCDGISAVSCIFHSTEPCKCKTGHLEWLMARSRCDNSPRLFPSPAPTVLQIHQPTWRHVLINIFGLIVTCRGHSVTLDS